MMRAATYRLITNLAGQRFVYPEQCFDRFEAAQSLVAKAVRTFSAFGRVTSVEVEQKLDSSADSTQAPWMSGEWTVVKCWGSEVVDRILAQDSLQRIIRSETPSVAINDFPVKHTTPSAETRTRPRWRRTRYALAGSSAVLAAILVFTFLWQSNGKPGNILRIVSEPAARARELPFVNRPAHTVAFPAMLSNWPSNQN